MNWKKIAIFSLHILTITSPAFAESDLKIDKSLSQGAKYTPIARVCAKNSTEVPIDHAALRPDQIKSNKIPPCPRDKPIIALPRSAIPFLVGGAAIGMGKVAVLAGGSPESFYGESKGKIDESSPAALLRAKIRMDIREDAERSNAKSKQKENNKKWYQKGRINTFVLISSSLASLVIYSLDEESINPEQENKADDE